MLFLRPRQVGAAAAAVRSQAVAERAVDAELVFARLGGFGIAGRGIVIVGSVSDDCRADTTSRARRPD